MAADALLSVREAAERLGVDASRVRQLIRAGQLPARRLGERTYAIQPADVEAVRVRPSVGRPPRPRA